MKLSVFFFSYDPLYRRGATTLELIDLAKAQGFAAVEPMPAHDLQTVEQARQFGDYAREKGLDVSCFSTSFEMLEGDRREVIGALKQRIDMAAAMGSPMFHHTIHPPLTIPRFGDLSYADALNRVEGMLRELCAYGDDRGVLCVYEDQGMYFNGIDGVRRLMDRLEGAHFGLVADLGNTYFVDAFPEDFIGAFSQRIVHVHCKDYLCKPGTQLCPGEGWYVTRGGNYLRDTILGHGAVNLPAVLRVLDCMGYDGWYSLEYGALEPLESGIPMSMRNLMNIHAAVTGIPVQSPG